MPKINQLSILGRMIFLLTLCGRDSYSTAYDGIKELHRLRRLNELIHRIASLHSHISTGDKQDIDSFITGTFETIDHEISSLGIGWPYLLNQI